jgi:hypothetical protein
LRVSVHAEELGSPAHHEPLAGLVTRHQRGLDALRRRHRRRCPLGHVRLCLGRHGLRGDELTRGGPGGGLYGRLLARHPRCDADHGLLLLGGLWRGGRDGDRGAEGGGDGRGVATGLA